MVTLTIRDNGIGFEPQDADNISKTFRPLHSKDSFEGKGLGLTLSKAIVER